MTPQDQPKSSIEVPDDSIHESVSDATAPVKPKIDWISDSDADSTATSPTSSTAATSPPSSTMPHLPQIPRVPRTVRENHNYDKYYVPKVVSIGPYHFGNPKLQMVQKLKLGFALKLWKNYDGVMKKAHNTLRSWVTSYVYLLGYLIDDIDDVKLLRKSWVLENYLVSDKEVVDLFDEIGTDLVENSDEYLEARYKIQKHYECWRNTVFSELKNEYFKSPWAFIALLGALVVLFLTGVQTYFAVWSPKNTCDDLCMFLKMNHHF